MNSEHREMMPGETMFEYLKRKKRLMLEKTVHSRPPISSTSRQPLHQRSLNLSIDNDTTKREEHTWREDSKDLSTGRSALKDAQETTARRSNNAEETRRPALRSFIQMISPIRSKSPAREPEKSPPAEGRKEGRKEEKGNRGETYTRKMLREKMNLMRETIESQARLGKSLKEKSNLLFVELKPFFRHLQNCNESGFQRKTDEIKGKVRALQSIFRELSTEDHHANIDQFFIHFSQYLNELEGHAKAQIEENRDYLTSQISTVKNRQIYELKDESSKLERQLSVMTKKHSKLEASFQEAVQQAHFTLSEKEKRYETLTQSLQAQLQRQKEQTNQLLQQVEQLKEAARRHEEERKHMQAHRQKFQQDCLNTLTRVKSEQQEFLLNEIVVLKKEFAADISHMAELYKMKEDDLLRRIRDEQSTAQNCRKLSDELENSNKKLQEAIAALQAQNMRVKRQNQCLATDMHRINEELYQHWLALKDIKTLSQRLDIFHKFSKIYQELLFNEQLFL